MLLKVFLLVKNGGILHLSVSLRGPTPFFTNFDHIYHFFFFFWVKKYPQVSGKRVSKYEGATCTRTPPPQMGANIGIYIYICNCMYHIIIVIISKNIS